MGTTGINDFSFMITENLIKSLNYEWIWNLKYEVWEIIK